MSELSKINERLIFGEKGLIIYGEGESSNDEVFYCIQVIEESVISISSITNSEPIVSMTIAAGIPIYGSLKGLSIASGKVIAYKR